MAAIQIVMLAAPAPYHAAAVKVGKFPLPAGLSSKIHVFFNTLLQAAGNGLSTDVFLQLEFLANGRDAFNTHAPEWRPEIGLGVWPDRPPPELWKITDLFRMARGERVPLMYQVARLTGGPKATSQALELLLGSGMFEALLHSGSAQQLLEYYKDLFLPNIKQPNLRIMPFYVPLLDLKSLEKRRPEELRSWLGSAHVYVRESPEDDSILIVTDVDLETLLRAGGAHANGNHQWSIE